MASVRLLLPDELLADIDAARNGPRLVWIRSAIAEKLRMAQAQQDRAGRRTPRSPGQFGAPLPVTGPARATRPMTRQGTLPDGSVCAHPFRDDRDVCRICGQGPVTLRVSG